MKHSIKLKTVEEIESFYKDIGKEKLLIYKLLVS
ncbi:hypothetical protein SAMN06313486_10645 [Epsilonproteobacteria bacterium SCGC AD-308-P11]|nr:hypothetical protein SAMN06313486_10645 [Epsilonproteobacteria bacterium SCGC AD-308-P11]